MLDITPAACQSLLKPRNTCYGHFKCAEPLQSKEIGTLQAGSVWSGSVLHHSIWFGPSFKQDWETVLWIVGNFSYVCSSWDLFFWGSDYCWDLCSPKGLATLLCLSSLLPKSMYHLQDSPNTQHLLPHPTQISTHNCFSFLFSISDSFQELQNQSSQNPKVQSQRIRSRPDLTQTKRKHTALKFAFLFHLCTHTNTHTIPLPKIQILKGI